MSLSNSTIKRILLGAGIGIVIGILILIRHTVVMDFGFLSLGVYVLELPVRLVTHLGLPSNIYTFVTSLILFYGIVGLIVGYFGNSVKKAFVSVVVVLVVLSLGTWLFFEWAGKSISGAS